MKRSTDVPGRAALVRQVAEMLAVGRSVLLYGPEGIGKSAIVSALKIDEVVVLDPFEKITRAQASQIRRALDRGVVYLAAARFAKSRELGSVGRILWRFSLVRVRELSDSVMRRIVSRELGLGEQPGASTDHRWITETLTLAGGRPGFAVTMVRVALEWRSRHGYLPLPAFVFAAMRQDAAIHALESVVRQASLTAPQTKEHP